MQILFLAHRLPYPPDKGERIRAFHEIKYLAARHDVDLLCFADSKEEAENQYACEAICRSVYVEILSRAARLLRAARASVSGESMSAAFFYSPSFAERVKESLRKHQYDVIFVYCSSMGQFIPWPAPAPIVADFVDADSAKWSQYARTSSWPTSWLYRREARVVANSELSLGTRAALSLVTTAHDAAEISGAGAGGLQVEVMANGVEIPEPSADKDADLAVRNIKPFVVFVGTMNYKPNSDAADYFARRIYPTIRRRHPNMNFVIVGRSPDLRVRRLASIPGVSITGPVPDVYKYFRNAEVSVAPFRISQGFHNKIAESLAVGTPVVASSRAAAGIGLSASEGLFVADTEEQFANTIDLVLNDCSLRHRLRTSVEMTRKLLSWETRLRKLEQLMFRVVTRRSNQHLSRELSQGIPS